MRLRKGGFPLFPKTALLITRVMHPASPTALHLASRQALVRFPISRLGPCQEHHKVAPPQIFWRRREEEKRTGYLIFRKNAQWIMLNHMTLPVSDHFRPPKLAISRGSIEGYPAFPSTWSQRGPRERLHRRGDPQLFSPQALHGASSGPSRRRIGPQ